MTLPIYQQIPGTRSYESSNLRYVAVSLTQLFLGEKPMFLQRLSSLQPQDFGVNYGQGQSAFVDSGMLYEINPLLRRITSSRRKHDLFQQKDTIDSQRHFIIEASLVEILNEFRMEWRG